MKPQNESWCYSIDDEPFIGPYTTEHEARSRAEELLNAYLEVDETSEYAIGTAVPVEDLLRPAEIGRIIATDLDQSLSDATTWHDLAVELTKDQEIELGKLVIEYVLKVGGFEAFGVANIKKYTYTRSVE